ncbi:hypothetical protein HXY32_07200 [Candidatus Bathyarchaeota archaeon]|nr:hypothetical protein [Candidatus Bathyarchaeota archaeon]
MKLSTQNVALMAVFAALQASFSIFPFTITVGVSGEITLGVIGGSLIGILLGPIIGGLAVLIGSVVGVFVNPAGALFGILTVIPPFLGAFGAGCVKIKRGYVTGAIILVALLIFYAHPFGREAYIYPWLHIIAMIVAFSPIAHIASSTFSSSNTKKPIFGISIAAFVGVLTDHISGSALAMWYFSPFLTPPIWYSIMPIYPIERMIALIIIVVIATPVYYSLRMARLINVNK